MQYRTTYESPIGLLTLESDGASLMGLWVEGQKHFGGKTVQYMVDHSLPVFAQIKEWLDGYFAGSCPAVSQLPLHLQGTAFQQEVWQLLLELPHGTTVSYGALAKTIAQRRGVASVSAQAVGRNPIMLIVPCHRVVGTDGSLTGYAGGVERKQWLLEHEFSIVSRQQ